MDITLYTLYLLIFFVVYMTDFVLDKYLVFYSLQIQVDSKSSDKQTASLFNVKINYSK